MGAISTSRRRAAPHSVSSPRFDALSEFLQALERPLSEAARHKPQTWPQPWRFALLGALMAQLLLALLVTLI